MTNRLNGIARLRCYWLPAGDRVSDAIQDGADDGIVNAMKTTIDRGGRIVVPKAIREAMGLTPGRKVDIVFANGRIEIEAVPMEFEVADDGGLPVIHALEDLPEPDPEITRTTLEQIRAERDARHM